MSSNVSGFFESAKYKMARQGLSLRYYMALVYGHKAASFAHMIVSPLRMTCVQARRIAKLYV